MCRARPRHLLAPTTPYTTPHTTLKSVPTMALPKLAEELYALFESENYSRCQQLLPPIKIELISHSLLVPLPSNTQTTDQVNDLRIAERIFEIGALLSLLTSDYQNFENYFASLRPFYSSPKLHTQREANSDYTKILSLYLIYLLSQGHISKFHVELESILNSPFVNVENDTHLRYPIDLERNLMEGNYIKIWNVLKNRDSLACSEYAHFTDSLVVTLRHEIARSLEKTNDSIPISNCKTLLYYPQEQPDQTFEDVLKLELDVTDWVFRDGYVYFESEAAPASVADNVAIINNVLYYAEQIESIV